MDTLDLSGNFLTELPTVAAKLFVGLRHLNLSSNLIEVSIVSSHSKIIIMYQYIYIEHCTSNNLNTGTVYKLLSVTVTVLIYIGVIYKTKLFILDIESSYG